MSLIAKNIELLKSTLPSHVQLIAVSKTKPVADLMQAYTAGQRVFGENKVQEMTEKFEGLPKDIQWHMIGHLQSNKVKYLAPFVHLIHGVDSFSLMKEINKQALKHNRVIDILIQFHIAEEETKFGFSLEEVAELLDSPGFFELRNIRIIGVMGMASFTDNKDQIRHEFNTLKNYFEILKSNQFKFADYFKELSMGMSGDYQIAIEEGSTMVRVGSAIFGGR